jgi:hypothetical protein
MWLNEMRIGAASLGLVGVCVIEAAATVRFVDLVHCVLVLHAPRGVVLGKQ